MPTEKKTAPTLDEILAELRALDQKYNATVIAAATERLGVASLKNAICNAMLRDATRNAPPTL